MIRLVASSSLEKDVTVGLYPDNTPNIEFEFAGGKFSHMILQPNSMQEFFAGMMLADSIAERGGKIDQLVIPTIPGGRQDRLKQEGDMLFTLKYVAKAINAQKFDRVVTVDPHSMATTALIDRIQVKPLNRIYKALSSLCDYDGVIVPDIGAIKRGEDFNRVTGLPVFYGSKHRDPVTNKLSGFSIDGLKAYGHYLVIDDLCDAGGTFLGLQEAAFANHGVTLDLFVTHGLFTKGTSVLRRAYNNIYSTDAYSTHADGVHYIEIVKDMIL